MDPRSKPIPRAWLADVDRWCAKMRAQGLTDATVYLRRAHIAQLARGVDAGPREISADQLLVWLGERPWTRETRRTHRSTFRQFFAFIDRREIAEELPRVKPSVPNPQPIPEDQLQAGLAVADDRTRLMLRLAAELGLRRGEIARIHFEDLTRGSDGWMLLVRGKGEKLRLVPVTDALAATMRLRCAPGGWLFPGDHLGLGHISPAWVGKLTSRALPGSWTLHKLRHRFATAVHDGTQDLIVVQQLLGHASLATTQAYVAPNRARMRSAVSVAAA